jgi:hypothetical protein
MKNMSLIIVLTPHVYISVTYCPHDVLRPVMYLPEAVWIRNLLSQVTGLHKTL